MQMEMTCRFSGGGEMSEFNIMDYFKSLRVDKNHHLGLGDIRLTIGQQEELSEYFNFFKNGYDQLRARVKELEAENKRLKKIHCIDVDDTADKISEALEGK